MRLARLRRRAILVRGDPAARIAPTRIFVRLSRLIMSVATTQQLALRRPGHVLVDERGNLWIADTGHHRIVVTRRDGTLLLVIGRGTSGCADGALHQASFEAPHGLALARSGATLYVADAGAHAIRRVDVDLERGTGVVTTVAGTGTAGTPLPVGRHSLRTTALAAPRGLALDDEQDALFLAAAGARQIWRVDLAAGAVAPCAGAPANQGAPGLVEGPALSVRLGEPRGLALAPDRKRLYVADAGASAVRILHFDTEELETLVGAPGMEPGSADGTRQHARLRGCSDVILSPAGLVVADTGNDALRGINLRHGTVTTLWRAASAPTLAGPSGVAFDREGRSYVVADTGHDRLVRVAADASRAAVMTLVSGRAAAPA
jgi:sugar lactone lactonase YvrE